MKVIEINSENLVGYENINPGFAAQGLKDTAEVMSSAKIQQNNQILATSAFNDQALLHEATVSYKTSTFIKLIDSEERDFLINNLPNAFMLLTLIATRARRKAGKPDGLEIGECQIGDHKSCGLSRQEYRTALKKLEERGHIVIIETCITRALTKVQPSANQNLTTKPTIKSTTTGTKVKLISSNVYDLNINIDNHRVNHPVNHRSTTDQPPINHEQRIEEYKERKEDIYINEKNTKKVNWRNGGNATTPILSDSEEKKSKPSASHTAASLLVYFIESLKKNLPDIKKFPTKKTATAFDELLKNYTEEVIKQVIDYAHTNEGGGDFPGWKTLVHTPSYLKSKFSKLLAGSSYKPKKSNTGPVVTGQFKGLFG